LTYPSEKYEFVSWDDDIPNIWKTKAMVQTTNQLLLIKLGLYMFINYPGINVYISNIEVEKPWFHMVSVGK
jgi:hypothetical protein